MKKLVSVMLFALLVVPPSVVASADDLDDHLAAVRAVGPQGEGHEAAVAAIPHLAATSPEHIPQLLRGMKGCNKLAENWLRAAVEMVADKAADGAGLPQQQLLEFLADQHQSPAARVIAFELIGRVDPEKQQSLVPGFVGDPSLELRRLAIARLIDQAKVLPDANKEAKIRVFETALETAIDLDQCELIAQHLKSLGSPVDLTRHYGFLTKWSIIGPFDNRGGIGFNKVYPPEKAIDASATHAGLDGDVRWQSLDTDEEFGVVDFHPVLGERKGVTAYAVATVQSDEARPVEVRIGTANAPKVWLNGKLVLSQEVYHAGEKFDQYVGTGELKKGRNQILVKLSQNEQTQSWAKKWKFNLRVCDELGQAVDVAAAN